MGVEVPRSWLEAEHGRQECCRDHAMAENGHGLTRVVVADFGERTDDPLVEHVTALGTIKVVGIVADPILEEAHVLFGAHVRPGLPTSLFQVIVEFRFDSESLAERQRGLVGPKHGARDNMIDLLAAEIVTNGLCLRDAEFAQRWITITTGLGFVVRLAVTDNEDVHGFVQSSCKPISRPRSPTACTNRSGSSLLTMV